MFQISLRTTYAVLAVLHLGVEQGAGTGKEIAERLSLPTDVLLKILQQLVRGRILESKRGRNGGFCLTRGLGEISLREVVESVEGPVLQPFESSTGMRQAHRSVQRLDEIRSTIIAEARRILDETKLDQLVSP